MRVGVVGYPGACDDRDAMHAIALIGAEPVRLWHADPDLGGVAAVIIPGGFSYGDYLRPGALAALSPVVQGVLRPNASLKFRCHDVALAVERESPWLPGCSEGDQLTIPMKHHDGCWFADAAQVAELERAARCCCATATTPTARSARSPA